MKLLKAAERSAKKIFLGLVKLVINQQKYIADQVQPELIKKIIIVHLDRKVGNIVLSTPMIEIAKTVFCNAQVDILIASPVKSILDENPNLSKIFEFKHIDYIVNPFRLFKLRAFLKKQNYDLAVESSNPSGTSSLNGFITYLTNAKYKVGFSKGSGSLYTNIHIIPDKKDHYYISKQKLINIFSKREITVLPKLFVDKISIENIKKHLADKFGIERTKAIAGIWVGARDKKKWDMEYFFSVYNYLLISTDFFPILLFGKEEATLYNQIDKEKYNSLSFDDLNKLKQFIACLQIFISGDTGPLHYAYALGINTIGIFLQDNYDTYGYSVEGKNFIIKPGDPNKMINEIVEICKDLDKS